MPVHPVRRGAVAADLEVLAQLLVADRTAFGQEELHLLERERVALDRGRVMGFLEPDPTPDALRLDRRRQSAEPLAELDDLNPESLVDRGARRPATWGRRHFVRFGHGS